MINIQKHFKLNNNYSTESIYDESISTEGVEHIATLFLVIVSVIYLIIDAKKSMKSKEIKDIAFKLIKDENMKNLILSFNEDMKELSKKCVNSENKDIDKIINKQLTNLFSKDIQKNNIDIMSPHCSTFIEKIGTNFKNVTNEKEYYKILNKLLSEKNIKIDKNILTVSWNSVQMYYHFEDIFEEKGWEYDDDPEKCDNELDRYEKISFDLLKRNLDKVKNIVTTNIKTLFNDKLNKIEFEKQVERDQTGPMIEFIIEYKLSKDYTPLFNYIKDNV